MKKLVQQGGSAPAFLSTHPAASDRVRLLSRNLNSQEAYQGDGLDNQAYQQQFRSLL